MDRGIWLGVLAGTLLGGGLALATRGGEPKPQLAQEPFRPLGALHTHAADASVVDVALGADAARVAHLAGPTRSEVAPGPASSVAPASRPVAVAALGASEPRVLSAELVAQEELRCARGAASACLDVGQTYAASQGGDSRALTFRRRALVLYAEGCQRREAQACRQLSTLYEHGVGVSRDANTAAALLQRYLELCASSQSGCQTPPSKGGGAAE